jgi:HAMP domain-containing protein
MAFRLFRRKQDKRPSMRVRLVRALGSIAAVLLLSGIISILEYRRMSDYVSELIASNIKSINLSQRLSDITQEYDQQMLAVVVTNDISLMPDFDLAHFTDQADSLKASVKSLKGMEMVDTVVVSFDAFMKTSMRFDEVFLADNVDTGEWFFGTLQPRYSKFRNDINVLNEAIHKELQNNSADFDAGFYRSIIPGVVSVCAGLMMIFLLLYFIMANYVNPIYRMSDGVDAYKATGRLFVHKFDGDDQLANVNEGLTDLIEENIELKRRIKALREKE